MVSGGESVVKDLKNIAALRGAGGGLGSARQVDEAQWKQNCIDLHQVMSVTKSVYLVLEHHNEALLRVAVELATCPLSRKILWWTDAWPGDYKKRDQLRDMVKEKLALAIAHVKNTKPVFEEEEARVDPEEFEEFKKKLAEAEAAKKAAQHQQQVAELRCKDVEEAAAEDRKQLEAMDASLNQLRAQLRAAMEQPVADPAMQEKLADMEAKLKASEQQCGMLTQKIGDVETKLKASEEALAVAKKEAQEAQEELKRKSLAPPPKAAPKDEPKQIVKEVVPKKLLEEHKREVEALQKQIDEAQEAAKKLQGERDKARGTVDDLRNEVEQMRRRAEEAEANASKGSAVVTKKPEAPKRDAGVQADLEAKNDAAAQKISQLTAQLEDAKKRGADAEELVKDLKKQLAAALAAPPPPEPPRSPRAPPPPVDTGLSKEQMEELEGLRKMAGEYEKVVQKLAKRDATIAELKEERAALEDEKMRMLRALHQVKEQLRRVQEIAEKKGYGKLVEDIMSEAKVTENINSPEWSCFDRLYEDALRRQKKFKDVSQASSSSVKFRPRGQFAAMKVMGMGGDGELSSAGLQPSIGATSGRAEQSGPYRHHNAVVNNSPCLRCGFVPSSQSGYFVGAGMNVGGDYGSGGGSSPSSQVRGRDGSPSGGEESDRQPGPLRGFKDVGPLKTPAMLADLPVRPASMQQLQSRMLVGAGSGSPLTLGSPASTASLGHVGLAFSPAKVHDAQLRSRSPMDAMLQQRAAGGAGGQALMRLGHSKSEPRELPRLTMGDFSGGLHGLNAHLGHPSPVAPGRMKGSLVNDRFTVGRGLARDRSTSADARRRGVGRQRRLGGHQEDFVMVSGDGLSPTPVRAG